MNENVENITQALSLRTPQHESLQILSDIIEAVPLSKTPHNPDVLAQIAELHTPKIRHITDFERDFPSICFSLATGVGKTRLMGAFITYLYLEKGIKNFFVVAPNLTIYNKLIADFQDISNPKYVFKGIQEFATRRPVIITGDNYQSMGGLETKYYENCVKINIFNIAKINREDRPDKKTGKSQFRSFKEVLGKSYFEYLQSLPDLVLLMDEAHRYRADAGMKTLNDIAPVLGLELTATAKTVGQKSNDFKNIIYHYSLANAIHDGYVKKPTIVGRSDFEKERYSDEKMEEIKLEDGFKIHEDIKSVLEVYSNDKNVRLVKPFLLIIAKDTSHADNLKAMIDADSYKDGKYKGKVIVVHSNQKSVESDENMALLLEVEKNTNPVEVVIHVNMLAEGWDVNNLYTIVPLKKADSKILVEQSIGRGLRLPYGEHTGVDTIDRLHIVAHDKFNDIVETAKKEGFEFQKVLLDADPDAGKRIVINAPSTFKSSITNAVVTNTPSSSASTSSAQPQDGFKLTFANQMEKEIAIATAEKLEELGKIVSSMDELKSNEIQERVVAEIKQDKQAAGDLFASTDDNLIKEVAKKTIAHYIEMNIKIPQVRIYKAFPKKSAEYKRFDLDLTPFSNLLPKEQQIIVRELLEQKTDTKGEVTFADQYANLEEYIIVPMLNDTGFYYGMIDTLSFFAAQVIAHIKTYAKNELELKKILFFNADYIAAKVAEQMKQNVILPEMETIVKVNGDYTPLKTNKFLGNSDDGEMSFRNQPKNLNSIKNVIFNGFKKCLTSKTKFDSNTERELAVILEDEAKVIRWDRLSDEQAKEKIPLTYAKENRTTAAYCPDFVVETETAKYLIETKAEKDMTANDVLAKKEVVVRWCVEATKHEQSVGGKPWTYVLIPHNQFIASRSFDRLIQEWSMR